MDADLSDHIEMCRAYAAQRRVGHYFSHETAALIHRLPLPVHRHPRLLHVAVFAPRKPPQMRGVASHELQAVGHRVVTIDGLPCVAPEDVWAQLSGRLDVPDLVAIGDFIITGDEPYSGEASPLGPADLERAVRHHGRRRGVRNLRLALDLVRFGSLSPQESLLRVELVGAGLPEPELNFRVKHDGRLIAMVDLAYPERRLAIEYLGDHHRTDSDLYRADIHRRERLASAGWNTVFLTAADLAGPVPRAVPLIRAALKRSSPDLFTPEIGVSHE
ncbi:hypothetical protein [Leifsonia sp. Root227]|uniref:hypothetical protein n=1 Tax=Leifsonia sp. Root227 TaxID=1736496 RepID=UPI0019101A40|nr:hypothetical protein [Leifsonia sp. Root227]